MSITINTPSEKDIFNFFLSLTNQELYTFSLYPVANTQTEALRLSKTLLQDKNQKIFGAFYEKKMIGFGILKFFPKKTRKYLCQFGIVLHGKYQGMGYGTILGEKMIEWVKNKNMKKIWLTVYSDNNKAIKLYKKLGFQLEGIFMYDEYFDSIPRHSLSMALFLEKDPYKERKELWENLSKTLALR